jgi:ABC-type branched-subunit amino acid transport system permease subunit
MSFPLKVVIEGIVIGLNYGLLALGLTMIYRTSRVLNFAQGQLGVVAAVFFVKEYYNFHLFYLPAMLIAIALAAAAAALSELLLRRLFARPRVIVMVATIGLSQVLYLFTVLPFIRPSQLYKPFPLPFDLSFTVNGLRFPPGDVLTLIVAPLVAIALALFVRYSPWGLAMRAIAQNTDSARLSGVWVRRTSTVAWTVAGILSAVAAILVSPSQASALTQPLSPDLLVLGLFAALLGGMSSLPIAFVAGIGLGVVQEILEWNLTNPLTGEATVQLILFVLLLGAMLLRAASLSKGAGIERSTWAIGTSAFRKVRDPLREKVGNSGVIATLAVAALLPLFVGVDRTFIMSQICIFAVIALSLTVLTGWAGQVSLGQFGLVAVGAIVASHFANSVPLLGLMPLAGVITALVSVVVGLTALRIRGLYLAVSTLAFGLFMETAVLPTSCWTVPFVHRQVCTGLPNPASTYLARPTLFGLNLSSESAFAWFSLAVLVVSVLMVRVWRDRGVARRLIAVRDNELAAAAEGISVVRTKLLAFALSGFIAGYAGVCYAFATQRFSSSTFDPTVSILVVSMVVIGGLDSIPGAILGALYLVGVPAIFGTNTTTQFLTSGFGLLVFILYLPGGMAGVMHKGGDLVTDAVNRAVQRWRESPPAPVVPSTQSAET